MQSPPPLQLLVLAHGGHEPPQSVSVSSPSFMPSLQVAATHEPPVQMLVPVQSEVVLHPRQWPPPSQTLPPLSLQVAPVAAFSVPQALPVQVFVMQRVDCAAQSVAATHATQWPSPSQTVPLLSLHAVLSGVSVPAHFLSTHETVRHVVPEAGQSFAASVQAPPELLDVEEVEPLAPVPPLGSNWLKSWVQARGRIAPRRTREKA